MSLVSVMIGLTVSFVVLGVVVSLSTYTTGAFAGLCNYVFINSGTQAGLERISRDIRQVRCLSSYNATNLTFIDSDNQQLAYTYSAQAGTLTRSKGGTNVVRLRDLASCKFTLLKRNYDHGT